MNERQAYETVVAHQLVDDDKIKRTARSEPAKRPFAVRALKPVGIALAALLLVFGVTMAIPAARAEVLSWFRPESAQEYLMEAPEDRETVPELDAMISEPERNRTEIHVNYIADEPYWREIGAQFAATLGETICDGKTVSIAIDFDGLSGYPLYEQGAAAEIPAGSPMWLLLAEKIEPEMVRHFMEDNADQTPYLSGSVEWWNGPDCKLVATLDDGTLLNYGSLSLACRPVDREFCRAFRKAFGMENYRAEDVDAIREQVWSHFKANGARAVASIWLSDAENMRLDSGKTLADYMGADGTVTLHLKYLVSIDHGEEVETKLDVDLGTVTVDIDAYKSLTATAFVPGSDKVTFAPEETLLTRRKWLTDENGVPYVTVTNEPVNLSGLSFEPLEGGTVDALGIRDLRVRMTLPEGWTRGINPSDLRFIVLVNGERLGSAHAVQRYQRDGSIVLEIDHVSNVPLDRLNGVKTVTLIPELSHTTGMRFTSADGESYTDRPIEPGVPYTLDPDAACWVGESTEYPQYAIVFNAE